MQQDYNNNGKTTSSSTQYPLQKQERSQESAVTVSWVPFSLLTWVSWLHIAVSAKNPALSSSKVCPPSFTLVPALLASLPQSCLGREERAETPHWPRWLAANQLQPKVIGGRWETFWWREQGEQVASCKKKRKGGGEKSQVQNLKGMREGKRGECKLFKPAGRAILEC